jgi:hypothetical protein
MSVVPSRRERLENARRALLHVHRALLEAERIRYEKMNGRVENSGALLQLIMNDPWFVWLRPMSALIVQIDEWLEQDQRDTSPSPDLAEILLAQVRDRLRPDEEGAEFQQRYHRLLQEVPAVAVAHAEVRNLVS